MTCNQRHSISLLHPIETHLNVWNDSFVRVKWFFHMCDTTLSYVWHDLFTFMFVTWLFYMCDMTHSYVKHDMTYPSPKRSHLSFWSRETLVCVAWLIRTGAMTLSYVWHDSFICVTWRIHMCNVTWLTRHPSADICQRLIHMCNVTHLSWDMTHLCAWHDFWICATWLVHMCDTTHPSPRRRHLSTLRVNTD